jgi:hypothetical protein
MAVDCLLSCKLHRMRAVLLKPRPNLSHSCPCLVHLEHEGSNTGDRSQDTASVKGEVGSAVGVGGTGASRGGSAAGRLTGGRSLLVGVGVLGVLGGRRCRRLGNGDGGLVGGVLARVAAEDVALAAGGD